MNSKKLQLNIIVLVLLALGLGGVIYKNQVLGFSLLPETKQTVWTVEGKISFVADAGPVEVAFNLPDNRSNFAVMDLRTEAAGYDFAKQEKNGELYGVWKSAAAKAGKQEIFLRSTVYRRDNKSAQIAPKALPDVAVVSDALKNTAQSLINEVGNQSSEQLLALGILEKLNDPANKFGVSLLKDAKHFNGKVSLARNLMSMAGLKARTVKGLHLSEQKRKQQLRSYIEIYTDKQWLLLNPRTAAVEASEDFMVWQQNGNSVLEVIGGSDSNLSFSTLSSAVLASRAAVSVGKQSGNWLVDFSIYSLPVAEQNAFKMLLLIPIGALVVVILRNLVGLSTSGTFMPILIAMVFMQTSLLVGLGLFLLVVSVGLILRSYLSHLNLLLVPRISAVLVFVIFIYVAIAVTSAKLGFTAGLQVTFFPMIIISWTIERMSILWEEEGPKDVFVQGGGSLFSASIIYMAMQNRFIGHITYSFPEILLVLLAIIIMLGGYSGYRLTELYRFEPMVRK